MAGTGASRVLSVLAAVGLCCGLAFAMPAHAHPDDGCELAEDETVEESCDDKGSGESSPEAPPTEIEDGRPTSFSQSRNMKALGYSERGGTTNSDLAFRGNQVIQGTFSGFRIIDVSDPAAPVELVDFEGCDRGQGDVVVYGDILVRSWDSPASRFSPMSCGDLTVPAGAEGLHVFDISDPANPDALAFVPTPCGSHTATAVPDPANGRLLVYNSPSDWGCAGIDIVEVPLEDPGAASYRSFVPTGSHSCHDTGVILGDVMKAACAGGSGVTVWSMDPADGGSLTEPVREWTRWIAGVTVGHSAAFSWDGSMIVFGHEPGGGTRARCQATSAVVDRTLFFLDATNGETVGTFLHPRPQSAAENCTWHNFNVVPTANRHVLVSGNYQSGVSVVDFTDPANAREIAFADPDPIPGFGGDWASYWYDGAIYQSDTQRGLLIWRLADPAVAGAHRVGHLNPQTQETSFAVTALPLGGRGS